MTTASLSKTKDAHPNRGDGKFTRMESASQCGNPNFLKPCLKLPVQGRRHCQNSGSSVLDGAPNAGKPVHADVEHAPQQLGFRQHGLRLRHHLRGRMLAAGNVIVEQRLQLGAAGIG